MISDKELLELNMSRNEWDNFIKVEDEYNESMRQYEKSLPPPPKCHFRYMQQEYADTGNGGGINFWECSYCGHSKEISYVNYNAN